MGCTICGHLITEHYKWAQYGPPYIGGEACSACPADSTEREHGYDAPDGYVASHDGIKPVVLTVKEFDKRKALEV